MHPRNALLCLVRYGAQVFLEKNPSPRPFARAANKCAISIDVGPAHLNNYRNFDKPACSGRDLQLNNTADDLDTTFAATSSIQAWSGYSTTGNGGVRLSTITSGTSISADGDWSSQPVYFECLTCSATGSRRFKLYKEIGGGKAAANVERTQFAMPSCVITNRFLPNPRHPRRRDTGIYTFDATVLGSRVSTLGSANPKRLRHR